VHTFDPVQFTAAMKAAVAERGADYVYPTEWRDTTVPGDNPAGMCLYVKPDKSGPACLIGEALHRMGVPVEELALLENKGASMALSVVFGHDPALFGYRVAAESAQLEQDAGRTWGSALDAYKYHLGLAS
jgi:hypothetical protein